MKEKTKLTMSLITVSTFSAFAALAIAVNNANLSFTNVSAGTHKLNLDATALQSISLEDYSPKEGKNDKKFTYTYDGDKYIEGALLFNDCTPQSVGNTLGDTMTLGSRDDVGNMNFNIMFTAHNITKAYFRCQVYLESGNASFQVRTAIKYAQRGYDGLYSVLESNNYSYDDFVSLNRQFYLDYHHVDDYVEEYTTTPKEKTYQYLNIPINCHLVSFDVIAYGVPADATVHVDFTSLNLEYSC